MSLHDMIMNLPAHVPGNLVDSEDGWYLEGHRDARHAAAELAAEADATIAQLVEALELALDRRNVINMHVEPVLRAALAAAKEQQ